jgi:hypothetical protein
MCGDDHPYIDYERLTVGSRSQVAIMQITLICMPSTARRAHASMQDGWPFVGISWVEQRRALHDVIAGAAVTDSWDARAAWLRFLSRG